ncbi:MAG: hypothetical protein ACOYMA_01190 [Bacteroidia bacterium]
MKQFNLTNFILFISCIALFTVIQTSNVKQTSGDSQLTLLTSQAIIENGNVNLSKYYAQIPQDQFSNGTWKFRFNNVKNQIEYIYPIGNSIIAIPFVFIANKLGMNMLIPEHDASLQLLIASLLAMTLLLLNFKLARLFVSDYSALFIALTFTFSTSYISTCGTALWSFNSELIFIVLLLIEIAKTEINKSYIPNFGLLGLYLFLAWLCRPSAMVFIAFFFVWMLLKQRNLILKTLISFVIFIGFFMLLSYSWYGTFIPFYYNPLMWQSMTKTVSIWEGFSLILFSPNRGLFVYSPFLIISLLAVFTKARKTILFKLLIGWFLIYILSLGNLSNWWGGWSFGARLCTDIIPCLFLLLLLGIKNMDEVKWNNKIILPIFIITAFVGFIINTVQGIYNIETYNWNDSPAIDKNYQFYKWNWQYPQFLANKRNNENKKIDFEMHSFYSKFILKTSENANILMGVPDANYRNILNNWNQQKMYGNRNFFNSINDSINNDTFYFFRPSHDYVRTFSNIEVLFNSNIEMAEFLSENSANLIILTSRGNWKGNISEKLKNKLFTLGLKLADLNNFSNYLAVINKGKIMFELSHETNEVKQEFIMDKDKLEVSSFTGLASTKLNGKELNINLDGINILVLNSKMEIEKLGYVNLQSNENYIDLFLYKAVKK